MPTEPFTSAFKCECGGEQEVHHSLTFRMTFVCKACGRRVGFNEGVARSIFRIEPMPPGALPCYFLPEPALDFTEVTVPDPDDDPGDDGPESV